MKKAQGTRDKARPTEHSGRKFDEPRSFGRVQAKAQGTRLKKGTRIRYLRKFLITNLKSQLETQNQ
jgi:hypothetical protein